LSDATTSWPWQRLNQSNANSHQLLASLLEPQSGERWLDVGTGGGGLALELASAGADVVGVDVAEDGLVHARAAAAERGVAVEFLQADAQALPFGDGAFDGVASTFGVIFVPDRERAAAELARVCRSGGRLGLTLMPLDSRTGQTFAVLERYGREGPLPASWERDLEPLLGDAFELEVERRESPPRPAEPPAAWEDVVQSFAPLRSVVERIDDDRVAALRAELDEVEELYRDSKPSYLIVLGRRR
jgi:SAM-dependent methyltransferase